MFKRICLIIVNIIFSAVVLAGNQQQPSFLTKPDPPKLISIPTPKPVQPTFDYKKINPNLQYAFIINKPTSPKPQEGDQISVNMLMVCNNRILFNSAQSFKGKPAVYGVNKPGFKGDIIEAIILMTPGDSIVCLADADAIFTNTKNKKPEFIKPGDKVQYFIKLVSIKTKEQLQKEQQAAINKQINDQMAKQKADGAKQMTKDDKLLQDYFTQKKISPSKTSSGLYYLIKEEGNGEKPVPGDSLTVNYTGTLLDGTEFDSNEDTAFHHVQPFQFILGRGQVIQGWEQGFALLKTGSKAIFYIPSPLAYGAQSRPGSAANPRGIPANSILLFNAQLNKIGHPALPVVAPLKKDSLNPSLAEPIKKDN